MELTYPCYISFYFVPFTIQYFRGSKVIQYSNSRAICHYDPWQHTTLASETSLYVAITELFHFGFSTLF